MCVYKFVQNDKPHRVQLIGIIFASLTRGQETLCPAANEWMNEWMIIAETLKFYNDTGNKTGNECVISLPIPDLAQTLISASLAECKENSVIYKNKPTGYKCTVEALYRLFISE